MVYVGNVADASIQVRALKGVTYILIQIHKYGLYTMYIEMITRPFRIRWLEYTFIQYIID